MVACCDQNRGISTSRCSKTTCALFIADDGRSHLPFDLVERVDPFAAEEALELEPGHVDSSADGRVTVVCELVGSTDPPESKLRGRRGAFLH